MSNKLNYQKVMEMLQSNDKVQALYQGNPVYIKALQRNGVTAEVSLGNQDNKNTVSVPLNELTENNTLG